MGEGLSGSTQDKRSGYLSPNGSLTEPSEDNCRTTCRSFSCYPGALADHCDRHDPMGIVNNPYGVGASGEPVERYTHCRCCGLSFRYQGYATERTIRKTCDHCSSHRKGPEETPAEALIRLSEHEPRLLDRIAQVKAKADEMAREVKDRRDQTASALRERDRYRAMVRELETLHRQSANAKQCSCGGPWPCETELVLNPSRQHHRKPLTSDYQRLLDHGAVYDRHW